MVFGESSVFYRKSIELVGVGHWGKRESGIQVSWVAVSIPTLCSWATCISKVAVPEDMKELVTRGGGLEIRVVWSFWAEQRTDESDVPLGKASLPSIPLPRSHP